jgi:RsiW-degrading membrane proteinase PrsW (M82 family)
MELTLFIVVCAPLSLLLLLEKGGSRELLLFLIIGMFVALFLVNVSHYFIEFSGGDFKQYSIYVAPIGEEAFKALPVFAYALIFKPSKGRLIAMGAAVGFGFAIYENISYVATGNFDAGLFWAIARGISTALMHALCTCAVSFGAFYFQRNKIFLLCLVCGLLCLSATFHSLYNLMMYSHYYIGMLFVPPLIFAALFIVQKRTVRLT